jgi:hypothetical protein
MIADAETVEQALAAIPSVIWNTSFGHILAAQTLALLGTSIALMIDRRWSWFGAVGFAGIAVVRGSRFVTHRTVSAGLTPRLLTLGLTNVLIRRTRRRRSRAWRSHASRTMKRGS